MVRILILNSTHARITRLRFSVPARCPAMRGIPRAAAQRPFPSITMAMCSGTLISFIGGLVCGSDDMGWSSNFHDFFFFTFPYVFNFFNHAVGEFLKLIFGFLQVIFRNELFLLELTEVFNNIAANVAGGNF